MKKLMKGKRGRRQLLTTIDEFTYDESIFIIAATNMEEVLDESLISRFQDNVEVELPNAEARFKILKNLFNKFENYEKKFTDKDLKEITDEGMIIKSKTNGFSIRDLENLAGNAKRCANVQKRLSITRADLDKAVKNVQKKIDNGQKLQNDKIFKEREQRIALYVNTTANVLSVGKLLSAKGNIPNNEVRH